MKLFGLAIILTVIAASISAQSRAPAGSAFSNSEQQVKQAYNDYAEAVRRADTTLLDRIVSNEAMFIAEHQYHVVTKSELLKEPRSVSAEASPPPALENIEMRIFGDAAVMSGRGVTTFESTRGEKVRRQLRVTVMFIRRDGRWQLVAMHTSSVR